MLKIMPNELLLIMSWYNNRITDDIIKKYKDRILFSFCDYYTVKYFREKFGINRYYNISDIDFLSMNTSIVNYYINDRFTYSKIISLNNNIDKCKVIFGDKNQKIKWIDLIEYKKIVLVNIKNQWNIPNEKDYRMST